MQKPPCKAAGVGPYHLEKVSEVKGLTTVAKLMAKLLGTVCHRENCGGKITNKHSWMVGHTIILNWECSYGHQDRWASSDEDNDTYVTNIRLAAAIVTSGNSASISS